jgi:hypothetical protein
MTMMNETLQGLGSLDPDDLAVVLCAAIRVAGGAPRLSWRIDPEGRAFFDVYDGMVVRACLPVYLGTDGERPLPEAYLLSVEEAGRILAERLRGK